MYHLEEQFEVDWKYYLGESEKRQTITYIATRKSNHQECAIRIYERVGVRLPRPSYWQWHNTEIVQTEKGTAEIMPYYEIQLDFLIKGQKLEVSEEYDIMLKMARQLSLHHSKKEIHGNLHPFNILFDKDRQQAHYFDALKGGNRYTHYCSPEAQYGDQLHHAPADVWALGILFIQLISSQAVVDESQLQLMPYDNPFFPEDKWLQRKLKSNQSLILLVRKMLNRNFEQRITMREVVMILEKIKNKAFINWSLFEPKYQPFKVRFCLIEQQQINAMLLMQKEIQTIQKKAIPFKSNKEYFTFCKNMFSFGFDIKKRQLKITLQGNQETVLLEISYARDQVPKEVHQIWELSYLVPVLYHTPADRFQFLLNGKLEVTISYSSFRAMIFNQPS